AVRSGRFGAAWMRVVVDLNGPFAIRSATLDRARSVLEVMLEPVSPAVFRTLSGAPRAARGLAEVRQTLPKEPGDGRLRVMLDPGHGGIDPGAEAGGLREADLALTFAGELRGVLEEAGYHVAMTREDDRYVPLRTRVSLARGFRADVLVSLHADALPPNSGNASGATVYTLSEEASDRASERLAARHDRADLLAGADLSGQGDDIAGVLMDLARRETAPRAENLAEAIVTHLREATGHVNPRPHRRAAFAVLKAPDIPSVLVELGFLSSKADRARLEDPQWRLQAARALGAAISAWDGPEARAARLEFSE
ncbi:MAG: N-acetylmuramoyl-L-alanine amidase, partial [Pseudomonadota bacterium]